MNISCFHVHEQKHNYILRMCFGDVYSKVLSSSVKTIFYTTASCVCGGYTVFTFSDRLSGRP